MVFQVERSFYDPRHDHGFWSPSTASSNFCEEDYQTSHYIGEFINTLSNFAYIYYAIYTPTIPINTFNHKPSNAKQQTRNSKRTFDLHTLALIAVGLTSGIYHMSLHSLPQWFDESSMYILAASFIHSLLTTTYIRGGPLEPRTKAELSNGKSAPRDTTVIIRRNQRQIAVTLAAILTATSYISYATGNLTIHSVTFGILLILSGLKLIYLIFTFETPSQIRQAPSTKLLGIISVTPTQKILLKSLGKAWALLNLAFGLWLIDCNPEWCGWLRYVRNDVLSGIGFGVGGLGYVTELHGWWHFFTARAAAEYIRLVRCLTNAG